jgi:separase
MRDDVDENFNALLEKLVSLAHSNSHKVCVENNKLNIVLTLRQAEESILMAKLTLHGVYDRLRTDMFLSSMTESS